MKRILITGKNSYIGRSFEQWINNNYQSQYDIDAISLRSSSWKDMDFSNYDVVLHTAGIAHIKETKNNKDLYYEVNRDLAYKIAEKSKTEDVGQFIFLSTMSVYGLETGIIDKNTPLNPKTDYGKSKLQAEELISALKGDNFKVAIIRPPMVYGKGCKGNYPKLAKLAKVTPVFPDIDNERSMIYIDNLSEFVKLLIDGNASGLFIPQNEEYVNTSEMVKLIGEVHGKKIVMTKLFNFVIRMLNLSIVNKVFGDLVYEKRLSEYNGSYNLCLFKNSIDLTEKELKE